MRKKDKPEEVVTKPRQVDKMTAQTTELMRWRQSSRRGLENRLPAR